MPKFTVIGNAHVSFEMTVIASDQDEAMGKAEREIEKAIQFAESNVCSFDVDVSIREADQAD